MDFRSDVRVKAEADTMVDETLERFGRSVTGVLKQEDQESIDPETF